MAISMQMGSGPIDRSEPYPLGKARAWVAFAMTFALMLSDYLSRQAVAAVFPMLKAEWGLSDAQLGSLVSVVALTVAVMSFPIALAADRFGRVKSITAMAIVWGLATVASGFANGFVALLIARIVIGLGEAGYGGAGGAVLVHVFPKRTHSAVLGAFMSAALFGSMLGVILGGVLAKQIGWRMAFMVIGAAGVLLALLYPLVVKEPEHSTHETTVRPPLAEVLRLLFTKRTTILTLVSAGFAAFMQGSLMAWAPSYLNRYYALEPAKAAMGAGVIVLAAGLGMVIGGSFADRLSRNNPVNRLWISLAYCFLSGIGFLVAFSMQPGMGQMVLACTAAFISGGFTGPAAAVVADSTPQKIHASALATLTLFIALLGMAPGPFVTGLLGDKFGLQTAMQIVPVMSLLAAVLYFLAARSYAADSRLRE